MAKAKPKNPAPRKRVSNDPLVNHVRRFNKQVQVVRQTLKWANPMKFASDLISGASKKISRAAKGGR